MLLKSYQGKLDLRDHGLFDQLSSLSEAETLKCLLSPGEGIFVV